jgi:hypothetical protein
VERVSYGDHEGLRIANKGSEIKVPVTLKNFPFFEELVTSLSQEG